MPFYLHQWTYKDREVRAMVTNPQDRSEVVRLAIEAFGGQLHAFYLSLGYYDGVAISEFPDTETAASCMLAISGQGALNRLDTTVLLTTAEAETAMARAQSVVSPYRSASADLDRD